MLSANLSASGTERDKTRGDADPQRTEVQNKRPFRRGVQEVELVLEEVRVVLRLELPDDLAQEIAFQSRKLRDSCKGRLQRLPPRTRAVRRAPHSRFLFFVAWFFVLFVGFPRWLHRWSTGRLGLRMQKRREEKTHQKLLYLVSLHGLEDPKITLTSSIAYFSQVSRKIF